MPGHVLIVTQNFPPTNEMASRRFGLLAPHLEQHGWIPWVLTTHGTGPLPVRIPKERVFRLGQNTNRLPFSSNDSPRGNSFTWIVSRMRSAVRCCVDGTGSRVYTLYPANLGWYREVIRQSEAVQRWLPRVDAVVGTFMPSGALLIASHLARVYGVNWLADVRDVASLISGRRNPLARLFDRWIEWRLFRTAAGFLTVSPTLARLLARMSARPAEVVYNGWDGNGELDHDDASLRGLGSKLQNESFSPEPTATVRATVAVGSPFSELEPPLPAARPYLYYAGLLYPHRMPAARMILSAMAARAEVAWKLRSLGPVHLERRLLAHAQQLGVRDRVQILPPCDPDVVETESDAALANVVLEDLSTRPVAGRGTLTGKFLKLLPPAPPVLAVARPDSDIGPIVEHTRKGRLCSSPHQIVRFLDDAISTPEIFCGEPSAVERYSMRSQAAVLARALDEHCGRPQSRRRAAA